LIEAQIHHHSVTLCEDPPYVCSNKYIEVFILSVDCYSLLLSRTCLGNPSGEIKQECISNGSNDWGYEYFLFCIQDFVQVISEMSSSDSMMRLRFQIEIFHQRYPSKLTEIIKKKSYTKMLSR
jgi:hypothetical protein